MIEAKGMHIYTIEIGRLHFIARQLKDIASAGTAAAGIHNYHFIGSAHRECHVHSGCATISEAHTLRSSQFEDAPYQAGTDSIVSTQQVAATDNEDIRSSC
jgi:hypothetical protein